MNLGDILVAAGWAVCIVFLVNIYMSTFEIHKLGKRLAALGASPPPQEDLPIEEKLAWKAWFEEFRAEKTDQSFTDWRKINGR